MSAAEKPTSYAELVEVLDALPLLLREARRARGLSMRAASAELEVGVAQVSRWERGDGMHLTAARSVLLWLDQPTTERQPAPTEEMA